MMYDLYEVKERHSYMSWCSISEFGWEVNERQVNISYCGCKSGYSPRRACQKADNRSVLVFVPVAIAQILPTRIQTRTISQMMMACYSNLMAMTLDLMAYLKNSDGNALRYYLRSAADQYLVMVEKLKRTLAEELKRILAPQQQIYKKKSTCVRARKTRVNRSSLF
jgi:hypothetical protein